MEFVETQNDDIPNVLTQPIIQGPNITKLREYLATDDLDDTSINRICSNAAKAMYYLPVYKEGSKNLTKTLCIGKVQSGKTGFFIAAIAMAFDNDFDIAYILGGTKNKLRDQNFERVIDDFSNNTNIRVFNLNKADKREIETCIKNGIKVVIVALKNASEHTNLGLMKSYVEKYKSLKTLIIDDEGDEVTPGAPKNILRGKPNGITHELIVNIINVPECCAFFSVTATPQANLLLSTFDEISPDFMILVEPGDAYTGGNAFHDTSDNPHVVEINDAEDFEDSIPESFINSFYFFIFGCALQRAKGSQKKYSMLVHPSSFQKIQEEIKTKISVYFLSFKNNLNNSHDIAYKATLEKIKNVYDEYLIENPTTITFKQIEKELQTVLDEIDIVLVNYKSNDDYENNPHLYKIYVGGNMLGRGLTIPNLFDTYMYRDTNGLTPIDTLYQRARWFGYKRSFFDICRVYMPQQLKEKFIDTVENENDMWNSIRAFHRTGINAKAFPRIFTLSNDRLTLTRKSVANTIVVERINPGYSYDTTVDLTKEQMQHNRELYETFFSKWKKSGYEKSFSNNNNQIHFIIEMKYSEFLSDFLLNYEYPEGRKLGLKSFQRILEKTKTGEIEDSVKVVVMRYKTKQQRSLIEGVKAIKELPQSWDSKTGYSGDRLLPGLSSEFHFQLHLVYFEKGQEKQYIPMIAFNNPITDFTARYVTGDNYYGTGVKS